MADDTMVVKNKNDSQYYKEAKHWYTEVYESLECSRNRYRLMTYMLGILLFISIILTYTLLPLKNYYYKIIEVNQQTGEVTQLKELDQTNFSTNWVVTRYFINQYVENRNVYHYEDITRTFNIALSMSDKKIADEYSAEIVDSNQNSPINTLGKELYKEVIVQSPNQLNANTALVRFKTLTKNHNNPDDIKQEEYQAVVKWEYRNIAESLKNHDLNPLGFFVTYYQVSPVYIK